ncbi:MAG: TlpA disulfide reductase family protein [Pseudomonadales bacterium]
MKAIVFLLLTGFTLLAGGCSRGELELADGSRASWSDWQGRWLLINYWAEWCAPCRQEIPELNRLQAQRGADTVQVLGVNFDGLSGEPLDRLITDLGIEFPVLLTDPRARWQQPLPSVLPSTLVINPEGELVQVLVGPQNLESLSRAIQATSSL